MKTCLKCGHENLAASGEPGEACPACGAIYAKVEAARESREASRPSKPGANTRQQQLTALIVGGLVLIGVVMWSNHQYAKEKQARAQQEAAERAAREAQRVAQERAARERQAEERRRQREAEEAAKTPAQRRHEMLRGQFHPWDGSHMATEEAIKAKMHNPKSYEHVRTVYADKGPGLGLVVQTTYRGTNAFGGVVTNTAVARVSDEGEVRSLEMLTLQ